VPVLDDDGLLWFGGQWVAVSDAQIPVVALILANRGRLTRTADILAAYRAAGCSATAASLKSLVHRIRQRFAAVGLELQVVRGRGVVLS
jgi:hypothetical protein